MVPLRTRSVSTWCTDISPVTAVPANRSWGKPAVLPAEALSSAGTAHGEFTARDALVQFHLNTFDRGPCTGGCARESAVLDLGRSAARAGRSEPDDVERRRGEAVSVRHVLKAIEKLNEEKK
jgi:hypothetical protein